MPDAFDLRRFAAAQEGEIDSVRSELQAGEKRTHWMWFIFPQIAGLGSSAMAQKYAIRSAEEGRAYWEHPILGPRLRECTEFVMRVEGRPIGRILPYPDDLKFRSCMTLFAQVATDPEIFDQALAKYFDGKPDQATLDLLKIP
jgi:uncharacterized protein (DUF1810 family)